MNKNELIEAIIREVKSVLAERGIDIAPVSGGISSQVSASPVNKPQISSAVSLQPQSLSAESAVGNRDLRGNQVITQKDLEAFTGTSVTVTERAVITPLAKDYAREKNITITRIEGSYNGENNNIPSTGAVSAALVISPDFTGDSGKVSKILTAKGFHIKDFSGKRYEEAVRKLATAVSSGSAAFGVCIEKTGMEGPIYANRNTRIRAVHVRDASSARNAKDNFGANVVVIDSASDLEAVISGFVGM